MFNHDDEMSFYYLRGHVKSVNNSVIHARLLYSKQNEIKIFLRHIKGSDKINLKISLASFSNSWKKIGKR